MDNKEKLKMLRHWKDCILEEREKLERGLEQVLYQIYLLEKEEYKNKDNIKE